MEFEAIISLMKALPEGITLVIVTVVLIASFILKRKEVDLTQITSISQLQTNQLAQLLEQNKFLGEELSAVRKELTEAYAVISDMRERIAELETLVMNRQIHSEANKE